MPTLYGRSPLALLTVVSATLFVTAGRSFAWEISGGHPTPEVPSAPRPADGAYDQLITAGLSWTCGAAVAYDVYLGTEENPPLVASNITNTIYLGVLLEFETVYHWRIVARDHLGVETSGPVWTFLTKDNAPPLIPFDPNPPHISMVGPTVVLRWKSGDPDLQPVTYRLFFGTTSNPPLIATGLTERSYALPLLDSNTTYYWRVVVSDGEFNVGSQTWRFYVMPLAVSISKFDAVQAGDAVEVTWDLWSDEAIAEVALYRRAANEALPEPIATVDARARSYRDDTVDAGSTYDYELVVITADDDVHRSPVVTVTIRPRTLALMQNYPNPFNPETTIAYDLPAGSARVRLSVFDHSGRVVRTLVDGDQSGGRYEVEWNGKNDRGNAVASGVYFYALNVGTQRMTRKLVLLK